MLFKDDDVAGVDNDVDADVVGAAVLATVNSVL